MKEHAVEFKPDCRHFVDVMKNRRPARLPLYEHIVNASSMERFLDVHFADLERGDAQDQGEYFRQHCRFFHEMTYDTVSYEVCIGGTLPGKMAICGGQGPIQSRSDFNAYPWNELPLLYWRHARPRLDALVAALPPGMKAVGGVGNGVFELAESLVGLEYLPFMEVDDPDLYADLFRAIGDLMFAIWKEYMPRYGTYFAACRFGDDLGFKSSLLTNPATVRGRILPQYRRVIDIVHAGGGLFLWHSCGRIFEIMDAVIALGINAKHSNEDSIAPFDHWIADYGDRIGLLGGFDMDFLCVNSAEAIYNKVLESGRRFRKSARGYALGSGNSIPEYVPTENYLAMIRAAQTLRQEEST
jgi:uroporphyrinogen decarboxylase